MMVQKDIFPSETDGKDIAPSATAVAASKPSFGQRVLRGAKAAAKGVDAFTNTFGQINPGSLAAKAGGQLIGGVKAAAQSGIDFLYGDNTTFRVQPPNGALSAKPGDVLVGPGATPGGERFAADSVETLEKAAAANAPAGGRAAAVAQVEAPAPTRLARAVNVPSLGKDGTIFGNLQRFGQDLAQRASEIGETRLESFDQKNAAAASAGRSKLALDVAEQESKRITALAARDKAGTAGKKVTTDLLGNPVVVDVVNETATSPRVTKPPTPADIATTAKQNKMSPAQVVSRLIQEGKLNPNDPLVSQYRPK